MLSEEQSPSSHQNLVCRCCFSSLFSLNFFGKDLKVKIAPVLAGE